MWPVVKIILFQTWPHQEATLKNLQSHLNLFEGSLSDISNLVKIEVYYEDLNFNSITETAAYTVEYSFEFYKLLYCDSLSQCKCVAPNLCKIQTHNYISFIIIAINFDNSPFLYLMGLIFIKHEVNFSQI